MSIQMLRRQDVCQHFTRCLNMSQDVLRQTMTAYDGLRRLKTVQDSLRRLKTANLSRPKPS